MTTAPYTIIFMGTPQFAVPALQALIDGPDQVAAVVTQPDRPRGRGRKPKPPPVKELALDHGIDVLQPTRIKTGEFHDQLRAYNPDLIVVAAYGRILPASILELPPLGAINVHGSLLPKYRGAAPIQWAILRGETETGITIMQMDAGMDTGDMLLQGALPIAEDDTSATLLPKMAALGGELLATALARLHEGNLPPQRQDEALATMAPPITKEQGVIDWQQDARVIGCQIRGLDPWPTAHTTWNGKRLKLFRPKVAAAPPDKPDAEPGTVLAADKNGVLIACGSDCLLVGELQKDGSRRLDAASFLCGARLRPGDRLGQ